MNVLLRALVAETGMSHAGLARRIVAAARADGVELSYDHTAVARWINLGQRPRGRVPDLICSILGERLGRLLTYADIGMDSAPPRGDGQPDVARLGDATAAHWSAARPVEENATAADGPGAVMPVWEWENAPPVVSAARNGATPVAGADVDLLVAARARYEQMYRRVGGIATGERVRVFLRDHGVPLLRGTVTDAVGRDLFRAAGGLAALAGICAYDAGDHRNAQAAFHQALRFAAVIGDRGFGAYVLALLTNQALALGRWRDGVAFAATALRHGTVSPALEADLSIMQARAYALMGSSSDTLAAIARAETAAAHIGHPGDLPEAGYVSEGMVLAKLAESHLALGNLIAAAAIAERRLRQPGIRAAG